MQVSVETGEGLERRMTVGLPADSIEAEVDKRLQQLARTIRMPGFRPGKVPVKVLGQRYGGQLQQEVFGDLVKSSFAQAVDQEHLRPAGAPRIEPQIYEAEGRYGYTAVFEVLPQFELGSLQGETIKRPVAEVAESDVDAMIERLRLQRRSWAPVERPAREGDRVSISYGGTVGGEELPAGKGDNVYVELGAGRMIPGFETGLIGVQAGEDRQLDLVFPEDHRSEELKAKSAQFEVHIGAVEEPVLPEVDKEFARAFGVRDGDLARFRQDVRENMERELNQRIKGRIKEQAMDILLAKNPIDLPMALVRQDIRVLKEQTLKEQTRQGASGAKFELPDSLFEKSARRRVALRLVIAEVVRVNGMKVDPERVRAAVEDLAASYEDPQEVVDFYYKDREHLASVESLALQDQVVDWVLSQVAVEDESASFQQLTDAG
jgi:trigger factor